MKKLFLRVISLGSTYSIGIIAQNILYIILIPLYTSYLSPKDFGIIALMTLTVTLITLTASTPINLALGRFYYKPEYKDKNDLLLFNLFVLLVVKTIILTALYLYLSKFICRLFFNSKELIYIINIYAIILIMTPLSAFFLSFIRLREMARYFVFLSLGQLILSCGLIIYFLVKLKMGILALIYGNIFGLCFEVVMCIPVFLKYAKFRIAPSVLKEPAKFGYPQILSGYASLLLQSGDRYILRIFNSVNLVGLYSLGYKISGLVNILLVTPLKNGLWPVILKKEDNPKEQKEFLKTAATYYYFIGMAIVLVLSFFAKEIVMILVRKEEFYASWVIIPVISFSYIQHGLGNFVGWGIIMKNKPYYITGSLLVSTVLNIGLCFIFIPLWGMLGAALATLISYIAWNGLKMYYSARFYGLYFDLKRLAHITIIGLGLYLLSLLIANTGSLPVNIAIKFLVLIGYPLTFFISGFFTLREKEYLKKIWVNIKTDGLKRTFFRVKNIIVNAEEK